MHKCSFLLFTFLSVFFISCNKKITADLIVYNATIYTVDKSSTIVQAMAIKDGKISETGTNEFILEKYNASEKHDANNKVIYPGLIDAHCHFTDFATDMWKASLVGSSSFEEILDSMKGYTGRTDTDWMYGFGWDQNDWQVKEFPDKTVLDSLYPTRPVFLKRIDGHAAVVNQKALDLAGVTINTKVNGGSIEIKDGKLTGILIDNAMDLVENKIPLLHDSVASAFYKKAQQLCFAVGLTSVHDCGVSERTVERIDAQQKNGNLKMRIFALLTDSAHYYDKWIAKGVYKTERLHVGGFKLYADGALGSRGACLLKDYSDKAGWKGFLLRDTGYFSMIAEKLLPTKFQMATHAIGDSGNRHILNTYARILKGKNDKRWRIEHAQVVNENDFKYFSAYSVIPSVQPTHATSDMYWAGDRLGKERVANAYAYKKLSDANGWIPLGTDFPIEHISPFKTFFAAVARKDAKDYPAGGYQMENALSREAALRGITIWAARAAFEENEKGSLEKGKLADFIIVDTDIMKCIPMDILKAKVISTYINGEKVHSSRN